MRHHITRATYFGRTVYIILAYDLGYKNSLCSLGLELSPKPSLIESDSVLPQVYMDIGISETAWKSDRTLGDKTLVPISSPAGRIIIGTVLLLKSADIFHSAIELYETCILRP